MPRKIEVVHNYASVHTSKPGNASNGVMLGRAVMIFPKSYDFLLLTQAARTCPVGLVSLNKASNVDDIVANCQFASIDHFGKAVAHFISQKMIPISTTYIPKLEELKISAYKEDESDET